VKKGRMTMALNDEEKIKIASEASIYISIPTTSVTMMLGFDGA
jgi:hypothetical protein